MVGPILDQCVLLEEKNKKYFLLTIPYSCTKELDRSISWDSHGKWIDTNTDMSGFPKGGFQYVSYCRQIIGIHSRCTHMFHSIVEFHAQTPLGVYT